MFHFNVSSLCHCVWSTKWFSGVGDSVTKIAAIYFFESDFIVGCRGLVIVKDRRCRIGNESFSESDLLLSRWPHRCRIFG